MDDGTVIQNGHVFDDAVFLTVTGQIRQTGGQRLMGVRVVDLLAGQIHLAGVLCTHSAEDRLEQLAAAIAQQTGNAQHLAGMDCQGNIEEMMIVGQGFQPQYFLALLLLPGQDLHPDLMAHHVGGQLAGIGVADQIGGHHAAVTQNGKAVADLHDLVELVADEHDAHALLLQRPHHGKDALDLRIGQGCGRLVHDDDRGVLHHGAGDLHDLLVGGVQITHHSGGGQRQVHPLKQLRRLPLHLAGIQKHTLLLEMGQEHVLIDGQVIDQVQLLMNKGDTGVQRIHRAGEMHGLSVQLDNALVGGQDAAQNVHQRGLASAVFTQQRTDLTGL